MKGQHLLSVASASGAAVDASGVQLHGVLDMVAAYEGPLGEWDEGQKRFVSGMQVAGPGFLHARYSAPGLM